MKTKTRDLSACLKRRLWIAGVCLAAFSFLSVSVVYAADDIQTVQQREILPVSMGHATAPPPIPSERPPGPFRPPWCGPAAQ